MIRAKITPSVANGYINLYIEWLAMGPGEEVLGVLHTEEVSFGPAALAAVTGYVSRLDVAGGIMQNGTFAEEAGGRRHYALDAEAGFISTTGSSLV